MDSLELENTVSMKEEFQEEISNHQILNNPEAVESTERLSLDEITCLKLFKKRTPAAWDLYLYLTKTRNLYLPKWKKKFDRPKWAQHDYLEGLFFGKYCQITKSQLKKPPSKIGPTKVSVLRSYIEEETGKSVGVPKRVEMKKNWLINVLYSVNPEHEIFKKNAEKMQKIDSKEMLEDLKALPIVHLKGSRLFSENRRSRKKAGEFERLMKMTERELTLIKEEEKRLERRKKKVQELEELIFAVERGEEHEKWERKKLRVENMKEGDDGVYLSSSDENDENEETQGSQEKNEDLE